MPYAFYLFSFVLSFFALSIALLKHSRLLTSALCPLPHHAPCAMLYAPCTMLSALCVL